MERPVSFVARMGTTSYPAARRSRRPVASPAFILVSDGAAVALCADGVFMLVNVDGTTRPMLLESKELLDQLSGFPIRRLGVIVVREGVGRTDTDNYRHHSYDGDAVPTRRAPGVARGTAHPGGPP